MIFWFYSFIFLKKWWHWFCRRRSEILVDLVIWQWWSCSGATECNFPDERFREFRRFPDRGSVSRALRLAALSATSPRARQGSTRLDLTRAPCTRAAWTGAGERIMSGMLWLEEERRAGEMRGGGLLVLLGLHVVVHGGKPIHKQQQESMNDA